MWCPHSEEHSPLPASFLSDHPGSHPWFWPIPTSSRTLSWGVKGVQRHLEQWASSGLPWTEPWRDQKQLGADICIRAQHCRTGLSESVQTSDGGME